ncbi:MAG: hypothetical protein PHQ23_10510 [Candidatus Wallbacteria bacterium]|nr:hypothetical protein [Candidatus Wallbacteria bacterium]
MTKAAGDCCPLIDFSFRKNQDIDRHADQFLEDSADFSGAFVPRKGAVLDDHQEVDITVLHPVVCRDICCISGVR